MALLSTFRPYNNQTLKPLLTTINPRLVIKQGLGNGIMLLDFILIKSSF